MKTTDLLNEVEFNKLSLNEKRIAIAKDVIIRINNSNFFEERGQILKGEVIRFCDIDPKDAINTKECNVCARGALLCSWIGNFNNMKWNDLMNFNSSTSTDTTYSSTAFPSQLLEVFDQVMLDNIEAAFENCTFDWHYDKIETQKYADAFERENEDEDCTVGTPIIELMEWIIEHKGEFPLP